MDNYLQAQSETNLAKNKVNLLHLSKTILMQKENVSFGDAIKGSSINQFHSSIEHYTPKISTSPKLKATAHSETGCTIKCIIT